MLILALESWRPTHDGFLLVHSNAPLSGITRSFGPAGKATLANDARTSILIGRAPVR